MKKSISKLYFSSTAILLFCSVVVMGVAQMASVMTYFREDKKKALDDVVSLARIQLPQDSTIDELFTQTPEMGIALAKAVRLIGQTSGNTIYYANQKGEIVLCSQGEQCTHNRQTPIPSGILRQAAQKGGFFERGNLGGVYNGNYYTKGVALAGADGAVQGYVFASSNAEGMAVFVGDLFSTFVLAAGLMLLAASLLAVLLSKGITTPIRRIGEAADRFGSGDFSVRVPVEGGSELAQLALTFNKMAKNLETIDQSRASFMGNIAHELRTPMTSIKGFVDGMLDDTIPPAMHQHYLGIVSAEVGRLTRLIQNMLDITKLEAGEYAVNAQSYDIWQTITEVVFSAEQRIEQKQIAIKGLAPQKQLVFADPDLVHQVVANLVDNAIKFTPEQGEIQLSVQRQGGTVTVAVENSGEGMSDEVLPYVFDRFYKGDQSRGLNSKGSGLGLHISKVLVGLSGGKIWAQSEPGKGTRFAFTLPVEDGGKKAAAFKL